MKTTTIEDRHARMTKGDAKMLALLTEDQPQRASELGTQLWGKGHRKPQSYARPAGRVLARLSGMGYARSVVVPGDWSYVAWVCTADGTKEKARKQGPSKAP